jgi:hypothetical protein
LDKTRYRLGPNTRIHNDPTLTAANLNTNITGPNREQQTFTVYTEPGNASYLGKPQRFLQNRVSYSYTNDMYGRTSKTFYSYDPHGNVEWLVSELPGFGKNTLAYEYDLVSNKVTKVRANEGRTDQYFHRYGYDEDNRILTAETSRDNFLWERDASYKYYVHGPLKRIDLGEDNIQGLDYTYTIHGWLKGINTPNIDPNEDYGQDGTVTDAYRTAPDVFGMALGYYDGDFNRTGVLNSAVTSGHPYRLQAPPNAANGLPSNLYNGNISSWTYRTLAPASFTNYAFGNTMVGEQFTYDRLNRIRKSDFWTYNPGWSVPSANALYTEYEYDPNGNITRLKRNSEALVNPPGLDDLGYVYATNNNQLLYVTESMPGTPSLDDIEDQSSTPYVYDKIGNLKQDDAEAYQSIKWTVYGKIGEMNPYNPSVISNTKPRLKFGYDASGNRISKTVYSNPWVSGNLLDENDASPTANIQDIHTTYYLRDASGNIMSTIERSNTEIPGSPRYFKATFESKESNIFGSDRLGVFTPVQLDVQSNIGAPQTHYFRVGQYDAVNCNFDAMNRRTENKTLIASGHVYDDFNTYINNPSRPVPHSFLSTFTESTASYDAPA